MSKESVQIQELRESYRNGLKEKATEIEAYKSKLAKSDVNLQNTLDAAYEYLHKLAGSSAMYGYEDIAKLSCALMLEVHKPPTTSQLDIVLSRLELLQNLLEQHSWG